MDQEKKRSRNFSCREESVLLSLVKEKKNRIECKKTDMNNNKIKEKAWLEVAEEFNGICGETFRDVKVLRSKYENIKKRTKQKVADQKFLVKGTGGGPGKMFEYSNVENATIEIAGTQIIGTESNFDDDCDEIEQEIELEQQAFPTFLEDDVKCSFEYNPEPIKTVSLAAIEFVPPSYLKSTLSSPAASEFVQPYLKTNSSSPASTSQQGDWSKYTPDMLRTPRSKALRSSTTSKGKNSKYILYNFL
ncbi:unnamed protein product [Brassicogethes aeneus]|uniref:Regulatory protein zeste n=1 Tax=Brassicogethes aeneus TaxID=1431903 RepID=A0A9P0AU74_BRAAE|nr:unnamed protein product [Brassicogethes aeneus]